MFNILKNTKVHHILFATFVIFFLCAAITDSEIRTDNLLAIFLNLGILSFILSGITYRFRNIVSELKNDVSNEKIHLALMGIFTLMVFYFFSNKIAWGDDVTFKTELDVSTLHHYLATRYTDWTSRLIIDIAMMSQERVNIFIWRVLTTLMVTISVECSITLFLSEKNKKYCFIVYLLALLSVPTTVLADAGWIATTTNYLWPLAAFMTLMVIMKKIFSNEKIGHFEQTQAVVLTLFAANVESLVLCILGISILLFANRYYKDKQPIKTIAKSIDRTYYIILGISLFMLLFALASPGNAARTLYEIGVCYPEFSEFSIIDKIKLGIVATLPFFYASGISSVNVYLNGEFACNLVYPINFSMAVLMLFVCLKLWSNKQTKILALQLLGIVIVLFNQAHIIAQVLGSQLNKSWYILTNTMIDKLSDISNSLIYLEILIYISLIVTLLLGIYHALGKTSKGLLTCVIVLAGFSCRFMMGFSPTIYASGTRTFLFSFVAIILATIIVIDSLLSEEKTKKSALIAYGIAIVYVFLLSPKMQVGVEEKDAKVNNEMAALEAMPINNNYNAKSAFRIDVNNKDLQPDNDTLSFNPLTGLSLTGWSFDIENKKELESIYAVVGNDCIKANYGITRTDVAQVLNAAENVGFTVDIPVGMLKQGNQLNNYIDFVLVSKSGQKYNPIRFNIKYPDFKIKKIGADRWSTGFHIEYCNEKQQNDEDLVLAFDNEKGINISGWSIDFNTKTKLGGLQAIVGDTTINATYGNERTDVADVFQMSDKNLGFKMEIPSGVLNRRKDITKIGFVLISKDYNFKYEPIFYTIKK